MPSAPVNIDIFRYEYSVLFRSMGALFSINLITVEHNREDADKRLAWKLKKECIKEEDLVSTACTVKTFEEPVPKHYYNTGIIYFNSEPV